MAYFQSDLPVLIYVDEVAERIVFFAVETTEPHIRQDGAFHLHDQPFLLADSFAGLANRIVVIERVSDRRA